jgi:hypothetical protein
MIKKYLYLDIDGVLCLGSEINPKQTKWGLVYKFNRKTVKVLNEILISCNPEIIISSDWKYHYSLNELQEIFEWQKIIKLPIDTTPFYSYKTVETLEEDRVNEILTHVNEHKPDIWVAIDDMNLSAFIDENHFVRTPKYMEGIKQCGIKEKIIKILNYE